MTHAWPVLIPLAVAVILCVRAILRTTDAAPTRGPEPREGRALEACMVLGCPNPWTVARHGWKVCDTHDHARPYDQEAIDVVADEAEQWLREHSTGGAA